LRRIYAVSTISFQGNFLYTPIEEDAFLAQYRPIQSRVQPDLVLLAEQAGRCVGYVFAIPDLAQAERGERISTVIVKTLAVLPGRAYAGLGAWLLAEVHATAARLGFTRAIHALMHQTNRSRNLSAHYARTIRRYTLLARRLT
jgi:GNAT superfamily N-acetyltransferase